MASITTYGGSLPGTIAPAAATLVWVRRPGKSPIEVYGRDGWWGQDTAAWTWIPWLRPMTVTESCAPQIPSAILEFEPGRHFRPAVGAWATYNPVTIGGCLAAVYVHNQWTNWPIWVGIVETEDIQPHGTSTYAQGVQEFNCYGLEYILDRVQIRGANTDGGHIDRDLRFNRKERYGIGWKGNRSTTADPVTGAHCFSNDGELWTNLEVLVYLLVNHSPITLHLGGHFAALDDIVEEHDFAGRTLYAAIKSLIPRARGLGWMLVHDPSLDGTVHLEVFSLLARPISFLDQTLDANENQAEVVIDQNGWITSSISLSNLTNYDSIRVEGGPVGTLFSLLFADGTLEEAWTGGQQAAYEVGSTVGGAAAEDHDRYRTAEGTFKDVFERYRVPVDWDFKAGDGEGGAQYTVVPAIDDDGGTDPAGDRGMWQGGGLAFERNIPRYGDDDAGDSPPRTAFALIADAEGKYHYVDKLNAIGEDSAGFYVVDNELALIVKSSTLPHYFALNQWAVGAADSEVTPTFDYSTLIATVFLRTDTRLAVTARIPLPPWGHIDSEKLIRDPEAELWIALAGTVTDVDEDGLVKVGAGGLVIRDDRDRLRRKAAFALAYYGQQRATMRLDIEPGNLSHPLGSLILGAYSGGYYLDIGTVVTDRTWNFSGGGQSTTVTTGFSELEIGAAASKKAQRK